jgi:hypothetical protein
MNGSSSPQSDTDSPKTINTTQPPKSTVPSKSIETTSQTAPTSKNNIFLANVIFIVHAFIVAFVLLAPFTFIPALHIIHISCCLSLLVHWYCNSNVCSLSMIESQLRGLDYTESFTHRLVAPIYDISKTTWSQICYIITIIVLCISIYKLVYSEKWTTAWAAYQRKQAEFAQDPSISLRTKFLGYISCFHELFMLC